MTMPQERSRFSTVTLPLLAGAALLFLGHALLTDADFIVQLGDRAARAGDHARAMAYYRHALQNDPENAAAPYGLARELAAAGDPLAAQRTLENNLQRHPRHAPSNEALADLVVKSLGDMAYPTVQAYYETALKNDPTRAAAALGLSKIYLGKNLVNEAKLILVVPLAVHDRNAALHLRMAEVHARLGEYGWADTEYDRGTALDPKNADALNAWGQTLLAGGNAPKAERVLRRALDLQPDNPLVHVHLAQALRELGRLTDSENELATALKKDFHFVPVYLEIASTLQNAREEDRAERCLRLCVENNPTSNEARLALADLLTHPTDPMRLNLREAASLRQACVSDTRDPDAQLLLGAALGWQRVQEFDLALILVERALTWGKFHGMSPEDLEYLRKYRQEFELALLPPDNGPPTFRSVEGRSVRDAADEPWPDVRQPPIGSLLAIPMPTRLDQEPGPGTIFDPALFTTRSPYQIGIRP
jgi:tetratricopeptide (TPR) repeat protein